MGDAVNATRFGSKLKSVIETAREQVVELIGAASRDAILTAYTVESNNVVIAAALIKRPTNAVRGRGTGQVLANHGR